MMTIVTKNKSKLDNEECFMLWVELGTLKKVRVELKRRGKFHRMTNQPFTQSTISKHALRWVLENPEEARPYYIEAGSTLSDEQWEKWMVEKAVTVYSYSPRLFFNWIERHGFEKYENIYEYKFGTLEKFRSDPRVQGVQKY